MSIMEDFIAVNTSLDQELKTRYSEWKVDHPERKCHNYAEEAYYEWVWDLMENEKLVIDYESNTWEFK